MLKKLFGISYSTENNWTLRQNSVPKSGQFFNNAYSSLSKSRYFLLNMMPNTFLGIMIGLSANQSQFYSGGLDSIDG